MVLVILAVFMLQSRRGGDASMRAGGQFENPLYDAGDSSWGNQATFDASGRHNDSGYMDVSAAIGLDEDDE